jgi:hypothetical protein
VPHRAERSHTSRELRLLACLLALGTAPELVLALTGDLCVQGVSSHCSTSYCRREQIA